MLTLQRDGTPIFEVRPGAQFVLPNGDVVSPAQVGWEREGYRLVETPPPPKPDPAEALAAWRETRTIPKADFCNGLIALGIIPVEEAVAAARGGWPASMAGFLEYLTTEQAAAVQIEWAAQTSIRRNNEFVLTLAWWANIPSETVDELFGWK